MKGRCWRCNNMKLNDNFLCRKCLEDLEFQTEKYKLKSDAKLGDKQ